VLAFIKSDWLAFAQGLHLKALATFAAVAPANTNFKPLKSAGVCEINFIYAMMKY